MILLVVLGPFILAVSIAIMTCVVNSYVTTQILRLCDWGFEKPGAGEQRMKMFFFDAVEWQKSFWEVTDL